MLFIGGTFQRIGPRDKKPARTSHNCPFSLERLYRQRYVLPFRVERLRTARTRAVAAFFSKRYSGTILRLRAHKFSAPAPDRPPSLRHHDDCEPRCCLLRSRLLWGELQGKAVSRGAVGGRKLVSQPHTTQEGALPSPPPPPPRHPWTAPALREEGGGGFGEGAPQCGGRFFVAAGGGWGGACGDWKDSCG